MGRGSEASLHVLMQEQLFATVHAGGQPHVLKSPDPSV